MFPLKKNINSLSFKHDLYKFFEFRVASISFKSFGSANKSEISSYRKKILILNQFYGEYLQLNRLIDFVKYQIHRIWTGHQVYAVI
jgi:hypothetical protein